MDETLISIIWFVTGLVLGAVVSVSAITASWQNDCEKVGLHREGDKVYECKLRAKP